MTAYILGSATLILLALIICRRCSPEFRRRSEQPKFQFLANLGIESQMPSGTEKEDSGSQSTPQKEANEKHEP
ncbi:MAG: hypothetical protein ACLGRW_16905 [Acidobacteriota bacterium]